MKINRKIFWRNITAFLLCIALCLGSVSTCIAASVAASLTGDINGDGAVDSDDLIIVRKALLENTEDAVYDVTGDGLTDIRDLVALKKLTVYYFDGVKFTAKEVSEVGNAKTVSLGDLFDKIEGTAIDTSLVDIKIDVLDSAVTYDYTPSAESWDKGIIDFNGTGSVTVTIREYCQPTSINLEVVDEVKFAVNDSIAESYGNASIITVGTIFSLIDGYTVDDEKVTVTADAVDGDASCTVTPDAENWENGALEFDGTGSIKLTIVEESKPTEVTLVIVDADKFALKVDDPHTVKNTDNVTLGELFEALDGVDVDSDKVDVSITKSDENATVAWSFTPDTSDWTKGVIDFSGEGTVTITIEEDSNPTDLAVIVETVDKFTAEESYKINIAENDTVAVGDLFSPIEGMDIDSNLVEVTVESGEWTPDTSDWTKGTVKFSSVGSVAVTIKEDSKTASLTVEVYEYYDYEKFDVKFENTADYLYRVGNKNAVALGSLFALKDGMSVNSADVTVEVTSVDENIAVSGTYKAASSDWSAGTITFTGTGPVKVTVACNCVATELYLEVIEATNVTSYSELGNKDSVLLNDITMSSGSSYYLSNATLYGNGFTFDMTDGTYAAGGNTSSNYVFALNNSNLDNVKIVGAVYKTYGATVQSEYNRAAVLSTGNSTITNSYISNCASAVRVKDGNLEMVNTTVKGGNFANIDIRGGHVTLDNVTTINQVNGNDTAEDGTIVVGLGVVIYYENVLNTTTLEIKNGITQYNYLSESQADAYIQDTTAKQLTSVMFDSEYSAVQYDDGNDTWVNTGILSMTESVGDDNISDIDGYVDASPSMIGVTGYLHTKKPDASSIAATVPEYTTAGQGAIAPSYSFDYTKNYLAKTDGSNDYCYEDNGTVLISMDAGDTFAWNTSILDVTKNGNALTYTVAMNGTDYTGKSISFNASGAYEVVYTYTDSNNYGVDEEGNITTYSKTYTKTVHISVAVIEASAKNAEFTMGSSNAATEKITIDNVTYVSATGVTADNSTWTYITINGQNIYYPIIAAKLTSTKGTSSYAYFPVFENVITITDYADNGTGDAFTYNSSTTTLPSTLTAVKGIYKAASDVTNWSNLTNSNLTQSGASKIFKWASGSDAPSDPTTYDNVLCYKSPKIEADRVAYITLVQYSYTDATNTTYYYYVGYTLEAFTKQNSCVTSDTLVTLADGTQKEIQYVTYEDQLLVWDFDKGAYTVANSSIIENHGYDTNDVIELTFEDGTTIKVVNVHGFFDADFNKWVDIDAYNVASFIGHNFIQLDGDFYKTVKLVSATVTTDYVEAWSILTSDHYNCILEGMFSVTPPATEQLAFFEIGANMKYDAESKQADVEKYGLYPYDEFAHLLTKEQFDALNIAETKIAVGKGLITYEEVLGLICTYA